MRALTRTLALVAAVSAGTPLAALAQVQTISRVLGLFNIFVGLMLVFALLTFATGFVIWSVRLGTWPTYRTEGVKIMEWGVAILFVLDVLLGLVQTFQRHPTGAAYFVSVAVVLLIIWVVVYLAAGPKKEEKKRPPGSPPPGAPPAR